MVSGPGLGCTSPDELRRAMMMCIDIVGLGLPGLLITLHMEVLLIRTDRRLAGGEDTWDCGIVVAGTSGGLLKYFQPTAATIITDNKGWNIFAGWAIIGDSLSSIFNLQMHHKLGEIWGKAG